MFFQFCQKRTINVFVEILNLFLIIISRQIESETNQNMNEMLHESGSEETLNHSFDMAEFAMKEQTMCFTRLQSELSFLPGEHTVHSTRIFNDDILIVTNYRLFLLRFMKRYTGYVQYEIKYTLPIKMIETIERHELTQLQIITKLTLIVRLTFNSNATCEDCMKRIQNSIATNSDEFYHPDNEKFSVKYKEYFHKLIGVNDSYVVEKRLRKTNLFNWQSEFDRMQFPIDQWNVSNVNKNFDFCQTYPSQLILPKSLNEKQLKQIASFRMQNRFPVVTWRSVKNSSVIVRAAQPRVGVFSTRCKEDENLIKLFGELGQVDGSTGRKTSSVPDDLNEIGLVRTSSPDLAATTEDSRLPNLENSKGKMLRNKSTHKKTNRHHNETNDNNEESSVSLVICDARSYVVAITNQLVAGGGCEHTKYYGQCETIYMNLDNLYTIRNAFSALRQLCWNLESEKGNDIQNKWFSELEKTQWLYGICGLLHAAQKCVKLIENENLSVLIHCSDGWDRTPQITSLAQIMLDGYYRTWEGFVRLIEKEWIAFGHRFSERCGTTNSSRRSPIFVQWLDCVYQIMIQFPSAFEFQPTILLSLAINVYSEISGTFLFDSEKERKESEESSFSVWNIIDRQWEPNPSYFPSNTTLHIDSKLSAAKFWNELYLTKVFSPQTKVDIPVQIDEEICSHWYVMPNNASLSCSSSSSASSLTRKSLTSYRNHSNKDMMKNRSRIKNGCIPSTYSSISESHDMPLSHERTSTNFIPATFDSDKENDIFDDDSHSNNNFKNNNNNNNNNNQLSNFDLQVANYRGLDSKELIRLVKDSMKLVNRQIINNLYSKLSNDFSYLSNVNYGSESFLSNISSPSSQSSFNEGILHRCLEQQCKIDDNDESAISTSKPFHRSNIHSHYSKSSTSNDHPIKLRDYLQDAMKDHCDDNKSSLVCSHSQREILRKNLLTSTDGIFPNRRLFSWRHRSYHHMENCIESLDANVLHIMETSQNELLKVIDEKQRHLMEEKRKKLTKDITAAIEETSMKVRNEKRSECDMETNSSLPIIHLISDTVNNSPNQIIDSINPMSQSYPDSSFINNCRSSTTTKPIQSSSSSSSLSQQSSTPISSQTSSSPSADVLRMLSPVKSVPIPVVKSPEKKWSSMEPNVFDDDLVNKNRLSTINGSAQTMKTLSNNELCVRSTSKSTCCNECLILSKDKCTVQCNQSKISA
ncbi:hypothetical protein SNEBB_010910 [Seison nebaliae]|nr:hypothetical protein SNEBB_010910 [Seison nebaliae]